MNLNKVIIIGRLTADIVLKNTPQGYSVASFSIATNRKWLDNKKQRQEETEFHNIVVWGKKAEVVAQYVKKGDVLMVEGRLKTRSWQDRQGNTKKTTEIMAEDVQFNFKPKTEVTEAKVTEVIEEDGDIKPEDLPF